MPMLTLLVAFIIGNVFMFAVLLASTLYILSTLYLKELKRGEQLSESPLSEDAPISSLSNSWNGSVEKEEKAVEYSGWVKLTTEYNPADCDDLITLQRATELKTLPENVKYLVLKGTTLFIYENSDKKECTGVTVLDDVIVEIYPSDIFTIDEIYNKDFPLRIASESGSVLARSSQVFLYASNASEKEDWFKALQKATGTTNRRSIDLRAERHLYMSRLQESVNSHKLDPSFKWLNALIGRVYYNIYKSRVLEEIIKTKMHRKTSRLRKPFFLGDITVANMRIGPNPPILSSATYHSLSKDGELLLSANIEYNGGFYMQIETELRIETYISRLPQLSVRLVLGLSVKHMEGKVLLRIKRPPTDRIWYGFYSQPILDLDIEPIVSTKAIKWSIINQMIQRRIQDAIVEFLLLPNMDDIIIPPAIFSSEYPSAAEMKSIDVELEEGEQWKKCPDSDKSGKVGLSRLLELNAMPKSPSQPMGIVPKPSSPLARTSHTRAASLQGPITLGLPELSSLSFTTSRILSVPFSEPSSASPLSEPRTTLFNQLYTQRSPSSTSIVHSYSASGRTSPLKESLSTDKFIGNQND